MLSVRKTTLKTLRAWSRFLREAILETENLSELLSKEVIEDLPELLGKVEKAKKLLREDEQLPKKFKIGIMMFVDEKKRKTSLTGTLLRHGSLVDIVESAIARFRREIGDRSAFIPVCAISISAVLPNKICVALPPWPHRSYFMKGVKKRL